MYVDLEPGDMAIFTYFCRMSQQTFRQTRITKGTSCVLRNLMVFCAHLKILGQKQNRSNIFIQCGLVHTVHVLYLVSLPFIVVINISYFIFKFIVLKNYFSEELLMVYLLHDLWVETMICRHIILLHLLDLYHLFYVLWILQLAILWFWLVQMNNIYLKFWIYLMKHISTIFYLHVNCE